MTGLHAIDPDAAVAECPELAESNEKLCVLNTYAAITEQDTADAAYMLVEMAKELGHRMPGAGMNWWECFDTYRNLGVDIQEISLDEARKIGKTVRTFQRHADKSKTFVLCTRGHIVPLVKGAIKDWSEGGKKIIWKAFEVKAAK